MKGALYRRYQLSHRQYKRIINTRVGSVENEKTPTQAEETECDDYRSTCQFSSFSSIQQMIHVPPKGAVPCTHVVSTILLSRHPILTLTLGNSLPPGLS